MECVRQNRWIQIAHQFPPLSSETVFTNICCSCYWCWCCRYQQSYRRSPSSCWLSTIPSWLSDTLCILHKQKHSVSLSSLRSIMLSWINLDFYRMNIQDDKDLVTSLKEMFQTHFIEWWHILQLLGHRLSLFPHVFFAPSHQINIFTRFHIVANWACGQESGCCSAVFSLLASAQLEPAADWSGFRGKESLLPSKPLSRRCWRYWCWC